MKNEILKYLKSYSYDPFKIDRLIVSSFLYSNGISSVKNDFIKSYLISGKDDSYKNLNEFISLYKSISIENLIELFEFVISPKEKVISGAVYTPKHIRDFIVNNSFEAKKVNRNTKICDPACGCAGFLYTAAKKLKEQTKLNYRTIFKHNIFGIDIQEYSIKRSKILLSLLAISEGEDIKNFDFNFYQGNSLSFEWASVIKNFNGFDFVIGNPPYVCSRNIEDESKSLLSNWSVCKTGHPDLYIPFFELGLKYLKKDGILGYITMNSFFKSLNARALREFFSVNQHKFKIIDFAGVQVFNKKSTYTCICLIRKVSQSYLEYVKVDDLGELNSNQFDFRKIDYSLLDNFNGWNLKKINILNQIEKTGNRLGDLFKSRNGIATLKNNLYIFNPVQEDEFFYYLQNGEEYPIERNICKDIINPNRLIKAHSINSLRKKVIFPYRHVNNHVELIDEDEFRRDFPMAYNYLSSKKEELDQRDKGKGNYEKWYAYGRNQSLEKLKYKLFFPHITPQIPHYTINSDENLLFHNGLAIIGKNRKELKFLKKIMSSRLFWFYIKNSSRLYGANYYSLSKNYFKNFGIYNFSNKEIDYIISENDNEKLNKFIEQCYEIDTKEL